VLVALAVVLAVAAAPVPGPSAPVPRRASSTGQHRPAPSLAWVDEQGRLREGDPLTGAEAVVGTAKADPTTPLVAVDGRLFWVRTGCAYVPVSRCPYSPAAGDVPWTVSEENPATGKVRSLGSGQSVFASADGRTLYIVQLDLECPATARSCPLGAEQLAALPLDRRGPERVTDVPKGWYVNAGDGLGNPLAVAGGVLVQSERAQVSSVAPELGLWVPGRRGVRILGRDWGLVDAVTRPEARSSLLAWLPGSCESTASCPLLLTDTATGRTRAVRSPLPFGFDVGGAFSPDGRQLAVFVQTNPGDVNPAMELALVDVATGTIRLVPGVQGRHGESVAWARWLPDNRHLLAGSFFVDWSRPSQDLVDAATGQARTLTFAVPPEDGVNFSASVVGPFRWARPGR
jgi:hypothetical protein